MNALNNLEDVGSHSNQINISLNLRVEGNPLIFREEWPKLVLHLRKTFR